jgi:hypothetical protein
MAEVFVKSHVKQADMLKILQNRHIYNNDALRLSNANEMSLGKLMENLSIVAARHGSAAGPVIKGLTKYATKSVNASGFIHQGWDWMGPIVHGRRFEIDLLAEVPDLKTGSDVLFETVRNGRVAKIVSDVDAFRGTAAWSIKRQGKTVDSWAGGQNDDWLLAYMQKVRDGNGEDLQASTSLVFVTGKGGASTRVKERLERIGRECDPKINIVFEDKYTLKPPPAIE